ncbi:hypothetical protein B0O99DRAFT_733524 [Bisporella sp. PMI_857]|nr:hypothetical protein B0O99DRAFT_733524 [Bisporella sp. PMI_857]
MSPTTGAASPNFDTAFKNLKQSVTTTDANAFQSTTLEDVWKAAEEIQEEQRRRKSVRNMRRIEPFLKGLEKYSKSIEILCNGTPYLPWIWAPIKLMLQLASEYNDIFDKLLDAYCQIAEAMPQFDRLQVSFCNDASFQAVLAMVYTDILEFHQRAYKFFRRRAWHLFFDSLWKSFEARFQGILKNLAHHKEMLMKEIVINDIIAARAWRAQALEESIIREKRSLDSCLHDSIAWLKVVDEQQDDELERLSIKRQQGTCEWVLKNPIFKKWNDDPHADSILWVKGNPGTETSFTTAYYICNSYTTGRNLVSEILRSLAVQVLKANLDLAPYIFENYANKGLAPSIVRLRRMLHEILETVSSARIIIDGLDEYPESDQRQVLTDLFNLGKLPGGQCRILFSNREGKQLDKVLSNKPTISLKDESSSINEDITAYVQTSLEDFRLKFSDKLIDNVQRRIILKAEGMFLWVRLVLQSLEQCHSIQELKNAVETLPDGLEEAYGRILQHIMKELGERDCQKAIRILQWVACSFRVMKSYEIQDGIVLCVSGSVLDQNSKLLDGFWELCKPLIEDGPKNTLDFVHYSAKEQVFQNNTCPFNFDISGPFLHYHEAHYNLAISCINYLNMGHCFIDDTISDAERQFRVVNGFHGLHHYANKYWFQHLYQCVKCASPVPDDVLEDILEEVDDKFWKQDPGSAATTIKIDDTTSADEIKNQLQVLEVMPMAHHMGMDIFTFNKFLAQEKYAHQEPHLLQDAEIKHDPTHFCVLNYKYQAIVQSLAHMSYDSLPPNISKDDMDKFKEKYLEYAFVCRYRECPRHSEGFSSFSERDNHETLHAKPLRCADPTCQFFTRGFTSKTGLLKHNRKYHPLPNEMSVPDFQRFQPVLDAKQLPINDVLPEVLQIEDSPESEEEPPPVLRDSSKDLSPRTVKVRVGRAKRGLPVHNCQYCHKVSSVSEHYDTYTDNRLGLHTC